MTGTAARGRGRGTPAAWRYRLSGLTVDSALELEELEARPPDGTPPDVVIRFGAVAPVPGEVTPEVGRFHLDGNAVRIAVGGVGRYLVRDGREIVLEPDPAHDAASLRFTLLGGVFGALCLQRGLLPLHASAVAVGGRFCAAFLGNVGDGKSTTAAFLTRRGYGLMADDVLVVDALAAGGPVAFRNLSRLNLREGARTALGFAPATGRLVPYDPGKRRLPAALAAPSDALPLRALYLLTAAAEGAPRVEVRPMAPAASLAGLLTHTYRCYLLPTPLRGRHLRSCTRVAAAVPVHRLVRPLDLAALPAVIDLLEAHFAALAG